MCPPTPSLHPEVLSPNCTFNTLMHVAQPYTSPTLIPSRFWWNCSGNMCCLDADVLKFPQVILKSTQSWYPLPTPVVLKLEHYENHLKDLLKYSWLVSFPRVSHSVCLGWGLRICISDKFLGNAEVASPGPHFKNHHALMNSSYPSLDLLGNHFYQWAIL